MQAKANSWTAGVGQLDGQQKTRPIKRKSDKVGFIKIKHFFLPKTLLRRMKRQATMWEKKFTNNIIIKGLVTRIYKELSMLNS